jgi:hypothetical protein
MPTRLAELDAEALDLADTEAFANEAIDIHVAHGHLSSSLAWPQPNFLDSFGCNQGECLAGGSPVIVEMTVAF